MSTVVCWFKRTLKQLEREQTDRWTDKQTDRQTDRQTDTHDDYRNPLAHARRGLTTVTLAHARRGLIRECREVFLCMRRLRITRTDCACAIICTLTGDLGFIFVTRIFRVVSQVRCTLCCCAVSRTDLSRCRYII